MSEIENLRAEIAALRQEVASLRNQQNAPKYYPDHVIGPGLYPPYKPHWEWRDGTVTC